MSAMQLHPENLPATLKKLTELEFPYEERYLAKVGKKAAVLALFAYPENVRTPSLLFIQRTEKVETHKGQMAFPGGGAETADRGDLTLTAQRETFEELGVAPEAYTIVGKLPELWTVSGFLVTPFLAIAKLPLEKYHFVPDTHEVAEVCWLPLADFLSPKNFSQESREYPTGSGNRYAIQVFQIGKYKVWGATGSIMKNMLDRLQSLS